MEYLKISQVVEVNKEGLKTSIESALNRLATAQRSYPQLILEVVQSGNLQQQIDNTYADMTRDPAACLDNPLSSAAGAYFLNEDSIAGSRELDTLEYLNISGKKVVPEWQLMAQKLKLGPGIGFVEPPKVYRELINIGLSNPELTVNYTAPFGNAETRSGIKAIMDSRIDPEKEFFPDNGVFLTEGATEGVDLFMEAIATTKPDSRVVFLGLSYYTGPFSAIQKGLSLDRLVANPITLSNETRFFPTPEEISKSLANDTSALVLTIPNNPNGEIYSDEELRKIIQLAKDKDIVILFDCLFENMFFEPGQNYQSRLLQIANELGALDRVVVVDGLSKTKNFAGERIGFLATINTDLITALTNIVLARRCNPRLILGPLVQFEGLARRVKTIAAKSPGTSLVSIIDKVIDSKSCLVDRSAFEKMYTEWDNWENQVLRFYQDNLTIVKALLDGSISAASPDKAAFNTFVKMAGLDLGTNNMDFLAKLMFTLGTYTQIGPCFGLSQKVWDQELGIWPRITYACSRKDLVEALVRLVTFAKFYAEKNFGDPNKFPVLQISYERQI